MPKLPRVSSQKTVKTLEKLGFIPIRQKGSHLILKKELKTEDGEIIEVGCVIPMQRKTLAVGTLKNILNQAGITIEVFLANL
ncbi:type II toxin-antitoxin system HicA family toxin [Crocosphaera sp. XPORK-15E]|uniref:type II toxin-antitoxin system HicA family toxin n=1 Tax=Crocosphaera sp. XPORK-15E TaxID=3110247 RepID=UPI002B20602F|nr:type II toxin-antitoxin system HicA family toxin [Crocosphaera sp. XPORK-15E]MEA5535638.1 type II toxin-antitoxin system HicA family toxin [Crocosphaera sp. XPORK-15E]